MLGVRRLRLTLMRPGDYGTMFRERIERDGLPEEVIDQLLSGGGGLRDVNQVRSEDRAKEQELRAMLRTGHVDVDKILSFLDSLLKSFILLLFRRVREMVVGSSIDKVYMVMDFGGMDLKVTHFVTSTS